MTMCSPARFAIAVRLASCSSVRGPIEESTMQPTPSNAAIRSSSTTRSTISALVGCGGAGVSGALGSGGGLLKANDRCS